MADRTKDVNGESKGVTCPRDLLLPLFTELPRWLILGNSGLKNSAFASCAGPLKPVGSVAVTGLVDAVNFTLQPGTSKAGRYLYSL